MTDDGTKCVHWFLVFCSHDRMRWWRRWLKPGFGHVFAVRQVPDGWIVVNPAEEAVEVDFVREGDDVWPAHWKPTTDGALLSVVVSWRDPKPLPFLSINSCVTAMKVLLGLRAPWVWTPWQLYRYCMARDNVLVVE